MARKNKKSFTKKHIKIDFKFVDKKKREIKFKICYIIRVIMEKRLIIIDSNALLHRAFHALPPLE